MAVSLSVRGRGERSPLPYSFFFSHTVEHVMSFPKSYRVVLAYRAEKPVVFQRGTLSDCVESVARLVGGMDETAKRRLGSAAELNGFQCRLSADTENECLLTLNQS